MKNCKLNVLLISPDSVSTTHLGCLLAKTGNYAIKTATTGRAAMVLHKQTPVDLVLCDTVLKGTLSSIETIRQLRQQKLVSVIYLAEPGMSLATDPDDNPASPVVCLHKPVSSDALFQTIDAIAEGIAAQDLIRISMKQQDESAPDEALALKKDKLVRESIFMIDDSIFVKVNCQFVKVSLADIVLLEASNMYVTMVTANRKFVLRLTLSSLLERLNRETLIRVHRSFAINIHKVDLFTDHEVVLGQHRIPVGRHFRPQFINRFQSC